LNSKLIVDLNAVRLVLLFSYNHYISMGLCLLGDLYGGINLTVH
jgi:hypothetical protein